MSKTWLLSNKTLQVAVIKSSHFVNQLCMKDSVKDMDYVETKIFMLHFINEHFVEELINDVGYLKTNLFTLQLWHLSYYLNEVFVEDVVITWVIWGQSIGRI